MKMRKSNRQSAFDIGFDVVSTLLLIIALLIVLYPLYFVLISPFCHSGRNDHDHR